VFNVNARFITSRQTRGVAGSIGNFRFDNCPREVKPAVVMNTLCGRFAIILATSVIDRALRQFNEAAEVPSYETYGCLEKGVLLETAPR
jgi:hypothetical protein